ncbi:MAG: methyltransferase domain-containing protein [Acidobacteriota bacterium]
MAELPDGAFNATIRATPIEGVVEAGQLFCQPVSIVNASAHPWVWGDEQPLNVAYRWLSEAGDVVTAEGLRTRLPSGVQPGQLVRLECVVEAPAAAGRHVLELDLVQEGVAWFRTHGSATWRAALEVASRRPSARLTFTGSCTREEFDASVAEQPWWYHSYYFSNGYQVRGDFDIGRNVHEYGFPEDLRGARVLDVGTASGWFALYFEQCGADVTALDVRGMCDYDYPGFVTLPPLSIEKPEPEAFDDDGMPLYFSRVSRGLWIMRRLLGAKLRYRNARVYDLSLDTLGGEPFDLVFLGSLLMHIRDPIGALMAARRVCRGRVMLATNALVEEGDDPRPRAGMPEAHNFWYPNRAALRRWLQIAGFREILADRTVNLTADLFQTSPEDPGIIRNRSQLLQLATAIV